MTSAFNAAENLDGESLLDGWTVLNRVPDRPGATGGNFSICYFVEHADGRRGFCKVLNIAAALNSQDAIKAVQELTTAHNFERDLHDMCGRDGLSRIVVSIGHGEFIRDGYAVGNVAYLIFEIADGDVRKVLDSNAGGSLFEKLDWLHDAAVGVQQLHSRGVAHQDLKPSNVLVFSSNDTGLSRSKVGDLGRATDPKHPMWHDEFAIAGDPTYAPPEQLYGATPIDFGQRRFGCDLYQLGSLITFLVTGGTFNAWLVNELHPAHTPVNWTGSYAAVEPYVQDAAGRVVARVEAAIPDPEIGQRIAGLVEGLCQPNPQLRGNIKDVAAGRQFDLARTVTELDLLSKRVRISAARR